MKAVIGSVVAAVASSACCLGPVVLSALGAGALGAAAAGLAPYRPYFLAATAGLLGSAFYAAYRRPATACAPSSRHARIALWVATLVVVFIATFPYYVNWLL